MLTRLKYGATASYEFQVIRLKMLNSVCILSAWKQEKQSR